MKRFFVFFMSLIFMISLSGCNDNKKNNNEKYNGKDVECINPNDQVVSKLPSELDEYILTTIYDESNNPKIVSAKVIEKNEMGEVIKIEFNNETYELVVEGDETLWKKEK